MARGEEGVGHHLSISPQTFLAQAWSFNAAGSGSRVRWRGLTIFVTSLGAGGDILDRHPDPCGPRSPKGARPAAGCWGIMFRSPASRRSRLSPASAGVRQPVALVYGLDGTFAVDHHHGHGVRVVTPPVERVTDDQHRGFAWPRGWQRRGVVRAPGAFGRFWGTGCGPEPRSLSRTLRQRRRPERDGSRRDRPLRPAGLAGRPAPLSGGDRPAVHVVGHATRDTDGHAGPPDGPNPVDLLGVWPDRCQRRLGRRGRHADLRCQKRGGLRKATHDPVVLGNGVHGEQRRAAGAKGGRVSRWRRARRGTYKPGVTSSTSSAPTVRPTWPGCSAPVKTPTHPGRPPGVEPPPTTTPAISMWTGSPRTPTHGPSPSPSPPSSPVCIASMATPESPSSSARPERKGPTSPGSSPA